MSLFPSCKGTKPTERMEVQVHIYGPFSHRDKRLSWLFGHFQQTLDKTVCVPQRQSGRGVCESRSSPCRESKPELQLPKSIYVAGLILLKIISFPLLRFPQSDIASEVQSSTFKVINPCPVQWVLSARPGLNRNIDFEALYGTPIENSVLLCVLPHACYNSRIAEQIFMTFYWIILTIYLIFVMTGEFWLYVWVRTCMSVGKHVL